MYRIRLVLIFLFPLYVSAQLTVPEGFVAEKIYDVPNKEQGSWISLAADQQGHLYAGSEKHGLYRFKAPEPGATVSHAERILEKAPFAAIHGLLYAFDSLYLMNNDTPDNAGLYRITDDSGDGTLDTFKRILAMEGRSGHGLHAIIASPDGKTLTINSGNQGSLPEKIDDSRVPLVWDEDLLLPRLAESNGHASDTFAPGGWAAKIKPDGSDFEILATGFRNEFDIAYNPQGELFTFDADMEWDMGTPWYRPTRVAHITSGAEFGWRNGSGKWPAYFPDSLPGILDIGPSSPTGICFGANANFPTRYRKALFICDWTYGQVYAIQLKPNGASYSASREVFCAGRPLAVVDAIIGNDGAMYLVTGGRNITSAVWRIRYAGSESTATPKAPKPTVAAQLRHQLESLHRPKEGAVDIAWQHLDHPDRFVRFAARIAIEHQPISLWANRVFTETDPQRLIQASLALARHGQPEMGKELIAKLCSLPFAQLEPSTKVDLLRALSLAQIRLGNSDQVATYLRPHFPDTDPIVNQELARLLLAANDASAVPIAVELMNTARDTDAFSYDSLIQQDQHGQYAKVIEGMKQSPTPSSQMHYAMLLRNATNGWTLDLRKQYAQWLNQAENQLGGNSYKGFIQRIRQDATRGLSASEKIVFANTAAANPGATITELPQAQGPGKSWTLADIERLTQSPLHGRDFNNGKNMYAAVLCANCHPFGGVGGDVGPDLTTLGTRFSYRDIAESIIEPSKAISEQYDSKTFSLKEGSTINGRIMKETSKGYEVSANPFAPDLRSRVLKRDVAKIEPSPVSLMPPSLINALNEGELLDLLAYLTSGGDSNAAAFR